MKGQRPAEQPVDVFLSMLGAARCDSRVECQGQRRIFSLSCAEKTAAISAFAVVGGGKMRTCFLRRGGPGGEGAGGDELSPFVPDPVPLPILTTPAPERETQ